LVDEKNLLPIHEYEKDLKRIAKLTGGRISDIRILGGEPLLHPRAADFLEMTRAYFPKQEKPYGTIELVTNGILLPKQNEAFWRSVAENDIRVVVSDYPVKIDKDKINELATQYGAKIKWYTDEIMNFEPGSKNQWAKIPMDIRGKQNGKKNFGNCFLGGTCFQLVNGKIYKCARIAYINYFNSAFNLNLAVSENDYVDIYKVRDINEIINSLCDPAPFCRYCRSGEITWGEEWKVSEKTIEEFV
jgi:sulfatase maturation enzyme AslB (radical SAM superfamily)